MPLSVALFVEGSGGNVPSKEEHGALARIWSEILPTALGCTSRPRIVPMSKRSLVALDRSKPPLTGTLPLDLLMMRELAKQPFDAAIVAWDLQPPWDPHAVRCRWRETLDLYRLLGGSPSLPEPWRSRSQARYEALTARIVPAARARPHQLKPGEIGVLCMEPMFEALLVDEPGIRAALGLKRSPADWPNLKRKNVRDPDHSLLGQAIDAAKRSRTPGPILKRINGDMFTRKNEWGAHFLECLLANEATRARLLKRPLVRRLREILP